MIEIQNFKEKLRSYVEIEKLNRKPQKQQKEEKFFFNN